MKNAKKILSLIIAVVLCFSVLSVSASGAAGQAKVAFDLNGDDYYSDGDAVYLLFYTFFPEKYPIDGDCDYNKDGEVTDEDALFLLFNLFFPESYEITGCDFSWHQCPDLVREYLENANYSADDYSVSCINDYAPATSLSFNTRPIGYRIGDSVYYNNVPGVEINFTEKGASGKLTPADKLRWIRSEALNVRDIGGWDCDGGTVKYGLLFRGGELAQTDKSVFVDELGIKRELNLRGSETSNSTSVLGDDILLYRPPVFRQYTLENTYMYESLKFAMDGAVNGEPVYFHCLAGADRTGTLAVLLEALLGMDQSDIDKEYELTMFYSAALQRTRSNPSFYLKLINEINKYEGDTFRDKVINYVKSIGITTDEINAFRAAMIDGTPDIIE